MRGTTMFKTFTSFADFDGCTDGEHLWCFDCWTATRQNRTWAVSDLPEDETRRLAEEYARDTYDDLKKVSFFDPSGPDIDYMGNFGEWYADEDNRRLFMEACEIENHITDDMRDPQRSALRKSATNRLVRGGLKAHMGEIEEGPMWDIIRDVLNG
jgi:hypothetical protein